ncbi:MAG: glycosyltransferase family protein [Rhodospirillales bacterium]|nr:glycosyltransferase family protein [Rhodospirillales bacterium]
MPDSLSDPAASWHAAAVAAWQRGALTEAIGLLEQVVAVRPDPAALANLGALLRRAGRAEAAVDVLRQAVAAGPDRAEPVCNLASALCDLRRWPEALAAADAALRVRPGMPEALLNRATALVALHRAAEAEAAARAALTQRGDWPEAWLQLGAALLAQQRATEAIDAYRTVLRHAPTHLAAQINLGVALGRAGRLEEAAAVLRATAAQAPDRPEPLLNLGGILRGLGRLEEAAAAQERLVARDPAYWPAWSNLGAIRHDQGEPEKAVAAWRRSLALHPDQPDAQYGCALSLLMAGDFAAGWDALECRWAATQHRGRARHRGLPLWSGEALEGATILLHAEEGLGDSIQFARYVPLVAVRGGRVVLETYAPLARLFAGLDGVDRLVVAGDPLPQATWHCPLQSLPRAFGTRRETIPATVPYLCVPQDAAARWQARLGEGRTVGLVWAGNPTHGKDAERSIPFAALAPLWTVPGLRWVSLQVGARAADAAGSPVRDLSPWLDDLVETAAAICALDLVIAVDTAVAHLAGALGRPVWLLLPATPDWRWGLEGETSGWYPSVRLFRQPRADAAARRWDTVLARVREALTTRGAVW